MRNRSRKANTPRASVTRGAASFRHVTGSSAIRRPRRVAMKSTSTSNENPSRRARLKLPTAASRENNLRGADGGQRGTNLEIERSVANPLGVESDVSRR